MTTTKKKAKRMVGGFVAAVESMRAHRAKKGGA